MSSDERHIQRDIELLFSIDIHKRALKSEVTDIIMLNVT
jgi:hypothetical protein